MRQERYADGSLGARGCAARREQRQQHPRRQRRDGQRHPPTARICLQCERNIRQLRVYAFNAKGEKVGYAEADNLKGQNYIPITLSEGGKINFYVIANDNFGPKPTVDAEQVTDWALLSKANLESLKFDLSGFTGWSTTDDFVSPMSNNLKDEFGNDLENNNAYSDTVTVTKPTVIPVTVQHVLGRLRLMLNKDRDADNGLTITVTRAAVYHSPNVAHLYTVQGLHNNATNITYRDTPVTEVNTEHTTRPAGNSLLKTGAKQKPEKIKPTALSWK